MSYSEQPGRLFLRYSSPRKRLLSWSNANQERNDWKSQDWIEHSAFGLGRVNEDRGDRLDIEFVASGAKTILKSTDLKPALSPSPDFRFPREKNKSRTPRFKVERPPRRPQLDFNHHTNLVFKIEKVKFSDGIKSVEKHNLFANALYDLLHGSGEMEARFTKFSRVVSEIGANNWPIATYFQFLASDGRWMFMKPSAMKRMADSLKIALNYKAQPN